MAVAVVHKDGVAEDAGRMLRSLAAQLEPVQALVDRIPEAGLPDRLVLALEDLSRAGMALRPYR